MASACNTKDLDDVYRGSCSTNNRYVTIIQTWTIDNFSEIKLDMKETLTSPDFPSDGPCMEDWFLSFQKSKENSKNKDGKQEDDYFGLFLNRSENTPPVEAFVILFILNSENERVNVSILDRDTYDVDHNWGYDCFITAKELREMPDVISAGDKLTLGCEIRQHVGSTSKLDPKGAAYVSGKEKKRSLSFDLEGALTRKQQPDILLKVAGEEIQAHSFMLSARSDVFRAMFEHDTVEKREGCVEIEDADPDVMREFVSFVYTDRCPRLEQFAYELFVLADRYNVENLKILAEEELGNNLTVNNVVEVLKLADLQNNRQLKEAAVEFVATHFRDIPKDEAWQELKTKHSEVLDKILLVMSSRQIV